jgi:hypothetical protein
MVDIEIMLAPRSIGEFLICITAWSLTLLIAGIVAVIAQVAQGIL